MRKLYILILGILSLMAISILYIGMNKKVDLEFYSPNEAKGYVMEEERRIRFDIYSLTKNPYILSLDSNQYTLITDNLTLLLEDVSFQSYTLEDIYLFRLSAKMPILGVNELESQTQILRITNSKYTLNLKYGPIGFLNPNTYPLLGIDTLFASYSYMNEILYMSGINLGLTNSYSFINSVRLGASIYGTLSKAKEDTFYENIFDIQNEVFGYSPKYLEPSHTMGLSSKMLFIPLGYKYLSLVRENYMIVELDEISYYVDSFDFMTNIYDYKEYEASMNKGEIIYA